MSSSEDGYNDGDASSAPMQTTKKRKIQRACDICRRKKSDGMQMPKNRCTNCMSCSSECTYVEAAKKRGPPKSYVEGLEHRVEQLEQLLRQGLLASLDGNSTIERPPVGYIGDQVQPDGAMIASVIRGVMEGNSDPSTSSTDPHDNDPTLDLAENIRHMAFHNSCSPRFLGKSSGGTLIQTVIELKKEYMGDEGTALGNQARPFGMKPWEQNSYATASPEYNFPDIDLALHCIDLYFKCSNLYLPLLHRPTFDKDVKEGLHLSNEDFGSVYLLVCAVGARYSDDPRVLIEGVDVKHSSGWKWFEQVQIMKRPPLTPAGLHHLQLYCLCAQYLIGSSSPQSFWVMVGFGIRLAQEVGADRRKIHKHAHTPEDELWKRAFWVLVCMDRMSSSALGRSCAIRDEDFDLDLPVDCDDEYWHNLDPEKCFKQPPNKPSSITAFILCLKLHQILAFSLGTIYSINKPKILLGILGQSWEQHVIAELNSALNKWVDSVPDHLRWDPYREDDNFFNQSASLYALYYDIQIIIHRPFIPSPSKPSPLAFPSLAICTNAARSCSHILDILRQRNVNIPPHLQIPAFTAGIVLLLNIWGGKRSGLSTDPNKEMADVHKCMRVLETSKKRWYTVTSMSDVLYEFAHVQNLPLPQPSPPATMKRERESDTPFSTNVSESPSYPNSKEIPRAIAGSRRVHQEFSSIGETQQVQNPQHKGLQAAPLSSATRTSPPQQARHSQIRQNPESKQSTATISPFIEADPSLFALPVYTNELGSFPRHGQIAYSAQAHHPQPQTRLPQLHPQTNHWYTMPSSTQGDGRSEPTPHAISSGGSLSYYPPAPVPPQQPRLPHLHQTSHSIRTSGFSSTPEMSSTTLAPYEVEAAQMAPGMMVDSAVGGLAYTQQQTSTYGWWPTDSLNPGIGSPSTVSPSSQSSLGSSLENVYGERQMDTLSNFSGGHSFQRHHQGVPQPQEQQPSMYPFAVDSDTVEIWANAPAGFGPADWDTYLPTLRG